MLPSRGTVAVFLLVRVLLSCQGRDLAGEQRRAVARGDTGECESFVGCGERSRGERIEEGSLGRLWEEGVVPFVFQSNMRHEVRASYSRAMAMWERETCIRFVPRTAEEDYVELREGWPCHSEAVGQRGGQQAVFLSLASNCASAGNALHELGHVLGFWHEHMRLDRDRFIKIQWQHIFCSSCKNFALVAANSTFGLPYDLSSIMHYALEQHSIFGPAIQVLQDTPRPPLCTKVGQRNALSALDVLRTNLLYNCTRELERPLKDDCQLQREANPPSFILTGDTVTFSGVTSSQRNMSLHCSATNCSLQPSSNNSSPIQLSIQTVYMSYRLRIHSEVLIVVGNNESWLDCSGPVCALTDCPQQGERKVNGRCLRHLLTIHFNDSKVGEGEQEGLKDGSAVSLAPAFKGTANRTCSNCPASPDTRGLKSLIVHKIY